MFTGVPGFWPIAIWRFLFFNHLGGFLYSYFVGELQSLDSKSMFLEDHLHYQDTVLTNTGDELKTLTLHASPSLEFREINRNVQNSVAWLWWVYPLEWPQTMKRRTSIGSWASWATVTRWIFFRKRPGASSLVSKASRNVLNSGELCLVGICGFMEPCGGWFCWGLNNKAPHELNGHHPCWRTILKSLPQACFQCQEANGGSGQGLLGKVVIVQPRTRH